MTAHQMMTTSSCGRMALVAAIMVLTLSIAHGTCVVESVRCFFPTTRNGETHYSCMGQEEEGATTRYFCFSQIGEKYVSGLCNGGCFDDDGSPSVFNSSVGDDVLAVFCKTDPSPCQFPFIWQGREFRECTSEGSEFPWCAVEVDARGHLVDGRWGKCDMATCSQADHAHQHPSEPEEEPRTITLTLPNLTGELVLSQPSPGDAVGLEGQFRGLPNGAYQVRVQDGSCQALEESSSVLTSGFSEGDLLTVSDQIWTQSLYPGDNYLVGRMLVIKGEDELVAGEVGSISEGAVIACTPIVQESAGLDLVIIIIIAAVAAIILIIILVTIICCCCCGKRRREKKKKNDKNDNFDSIDDEHVGNGKARTPLYDELSIPFIDASLPPTPKMGRSTDQLAFLLGNTRGSKSSLSSIAGPVNPTPI